jgi:restriction endonuclease Mrr
MTEFYSNLPQKLKDNLQKTADRLVDENYKNKFEFNVNDYDAAVGFFVKRGFARQPAEDTAYIILQQAKIDNVPVGELLDQITYADPAKLSELITTVLNANRYKSSRLGVRNTRSVKDTVSRNIVD